MLSKLASNFGSLVAKYVLPYLFNKVQDLIEDFLKEVFEFYKTKRAYKEATEEARVKYDEVFKNPDSTVDQKAQAVTDLINSKPSL